MLDDLNSDWDFYGPVYLFEQEGNGDITDKDVAVARAAKDFFFKDSVIDLDGLDRFVLMYTDALYQ